MESHELPFNQLKLDAMLSFLKTSGPNQSYVITKDYHLKRKYQKVVIEKIFSPRPFRQVLDLNAFNVFDNMGYVTFLDDTSNISVYEIKLCYNKLALPLWARHRESGDILEMPYGHKKLKDFYIDKKIPLDQRDKDIVITDNHNRILAVLGRYYNQSTDLTDSIKLRYKRGIL
jgi:tRNA(Ile)-lysidine synthase